MSDASLKRVRVVAALFRRGNAVLAQRRPDGKARAQLWEFPGGKVENGESDADALARECQEELGIVCTVGARLWSTCHHYEDLIVELVVYAANMQPGACPEPRDASELRWAPIAELADLPFCPADRDLVNRLAAGTLRLV